MADRRRRALARYEAMRAVLGAESHEVTPIPGGETVELARGDCRAKIDVYPDRGYAVWTNIESPGDQGWLDDAHKAVRKLPRAVRVLYAWPGTDRNRRSLLKRGPWVEQPDGSLAWERHR